MAMGVGGEATERRTLSWRPMAAIGGKRRRCHIVISRAVRSRPTLLPAERLTTTDMNARAVGPRAPQVSRTKG